MPKPISTASQTGAIPAEVVVACCGGGGVVAEALDITRQTAFHWDVIPAERCADIEALSGIPREMLRPDIYRKKSKLRRSKTAISLKEARAKVAARSPAKSRRGSARRAA